MRAFVDRVLEVEREASGGGAIGDFERSLHHNVCAVVVNLAADVASTIRLGCFGHDLTLDVRPIAAWLDTLTTDELRKRAGAFGGSTATHSGGARRRARRGDPPRVRERVLRAGRRRADVYRRVFGFYSVAWTRAAYDAAFRFGRRHGRGAADRDPASC